MGKLFGTDGIRGIVGENLTVELAFRTGQALAHVLKQEKGRAPLITIGKDTRVSSDMLESALICGICSVGGNVMPFGVLPTPAVAYLTVLKEADAGIVISASHNPFEHNGIKVFNEQGYKLPDATEEKIEAVILSEEKIPVATRGEIGVLHHGLKQAKNEYIHHLAHTIDADLAGLRILVDCSNGAASATARELFGRFKCFVDFICDEPNGVNINLNCGSTHLDRLAEQVVAGKYDIGVAFDGDADRCLMVDETGKVIDGDMITTLLRSTDYPAHFYDRGEHDFSYAFLPHAGGPALGEVAEAGYLFNSPFVVLAGEAEKAAPLTLSDSGMMLDCVKPAEDGNGIIVRLYEPYGTSGQVTAALPAEATVLGTSPLEETLEDCGVCTSFTVEYKPFDIRTFRIIR